MLKKIISLLLTAALLIGTAAVLGSCDDNGTEEPTGTTYTVTVLDGETPVSGAKITFINAAGNKKLATTDANGVASYTPEDDGVWQAQVFQANGYEFDKDTKYDFTDGKVTISLSKTEENTVTLTVNVVDAENNPVSGVQVQVCDTAGVCKTPVTTDADGKATFVVDADKTWKTTFYPSDDNSEYVYFENNEATLVKAE